MTSSLPPHFVLVSHSSTTSRQSTTAFCHPEIHYHYSDDDPLPLLPQHPDQHVLLLDYRPPNSTAHVQSLSSSIAVTGVKIEEAPGATASNEGKNDSMFIIETRSDDKQPSVAHAEKSPRKTLAEYRHRNAILRNVLQYPAHPTSSINKELQCSRSV
ncbi:hypothetical protein BDQ17DRAFT_1340871 [Cyathus striatus]|nr:hypothetical protein BDQ17DRAFT_1340871 [Cyathus striatus]